MRIIVDAMGGDNAPQEIIKGCVEADVGDAEIVLCGEEEIIKDYLNRFQYKGSNIRIHNAREIIENDDMPTKAIKAKKDSSMVVGLNLLKEGKGDVFLSAGNTGALMTGALLLVSRIKGIDRPALSPVVPSAKGPVLLVDGGSNTNCKPENLLQFAIMGSVYMKTTLGVENPKVGLVNIGTEEIKGNELTKQAFVLLEKSGLNFVGNIEGRDIPMGNVDIAVCDGFVGNVILKVMEGMGKTFSKMLKDEANKNLLSKIGGLFLLPALKNFKKKMDYAEHGGALYLGIEKAVIKCHGSSSAKSITKAIKQAQAFEKNKTVEKIKENLRSFGGNNSDTSE